MIISELSVVFEEIGMDLKIFSMFYVELRMLFQELVMSCKEFCIGCKGSA